MALNEALSTTFYTFSTCGNVLFLSKVTYLEENVKKDDIMPCRNFTEK